MAFLPVNPTNGQVADGGDGYLYTAYYRPPSGTRYLWLKTGVSANANGIISGAINAITNAINAGNVTLTGNVLNVGNVTLTANGLTLGNIALTANGLSAGNVLVTANGINAGNTTLSENGISVGNVILTPNGITIGNVTLTSNGLTVGNVVFNDNALNIGNITLSDNSLSTGNATLSDNTLTLGNVFGNNFTSVGEGNVTLSNTLSNTITIITGEGITLTNVETGVTLNFNSANTFVNSVNGSNGNVILYFTSNTEPNASTIGSIWYKPDSGNIYFYVNNNSSNIWVEVAPGSLAGVSAVNGLTGNVTLTTANIAENGNLYFTNTRSFANVLNYLNSGLNSIFINGYGGANGQILVANGDNTINYHTRFFSNVFPPDFAHYGDVWYDTEFAKMYMYVFDEAGEFWFDFLPPDF